MDLGQRILGRRHIDPSVISVLVGLQVEGTFRTGTHLVTIDQPITTDDGDLELAMYGSCMDPPSQDLFPEVDVRDFAHKKMSGCIIAAKSGNITLSKERKRIRLKVTNKGDRPVQVRFANLSREQWFISQIGWLPLSFYRNESVSGF